MQVRDPALQRSVIACGSMVLFDLLVCGFSARSAEKPHTRRSEHMLNSTNSTEQRS
jgi:hypothetical protein